MSDDKQLGGVLDLTAQVDARREHLECLITQERARIEMARESIAKFKAELDALPVPRRRRKVASEQKTGGDHG
jgi:hypothetical protein